MTSLEWQTDFLRPTKTRIVDLRPDLTFEAGSRAVVVADPLTLCYHDIVAIRPRRSFVDWLLGRSEPPTHELGLVTFAGGTFSWIAPGYAGTERTVWRRGDRIEVVSVCQSSEHPHPSRPDQ